MKISDWKIDVAKLEDGAWVDNIPDLGDVRLKVRGFGNKKAEALTRKLTDAVPRKLKIGGRPTPEENDRILAIVLRECILLDWDNVEDETGAQVPYSKELANTFLTDTEDLRFRNGVAWAASFVADARNADQDEAVKN